MKGGQKMLRVLQSIASAYENSAQPVAVADADLRVFRANKEALKTIPEIATPGGLKNILGEEEFSRVCLELANGKECELRYPSSPFQMILGRAVPFMNEDHQLIGSMISFQFQEKRINNEELCAWMTDTMSRNIREPVSTIFSILALLSRQIDRGEFDPADGSISHISTCCYKLLHTATNYSQFLHLESNSVKPSLRQMEMVAFLKELLAAGSMLVSSAGVQLEVSLPEERVHMLADAELIQTMLLNILSGFCHPKAEHTEISVSVFRQKDRLNLLVTDKDRVVDPRSLSEITLPASMALEHLPTTGLGVEFMIASRIAALHNGSVMMDSKEGSGTSILISLPIRIDPSAPISASSKAAEYVTNRFSPLYVHFADLEIQPTP